MGGLQQELKDSLKSRPNRANPQYFTGKVLLSDLGGQMVVNSDTANQIYKYLFKNEYLDDDDNLLAKFQDDKDNGNLPTLPEDLKPFTHSIINLIDSVVNTKLLAGMIDNGNKPKNRLNPTNLARKEFQALWRRINQKAIFQINLDSQILIEASIKAVDNTSRDKGGKFVPSLTYTIKTAEQTDHLDYDTLNAGEGFEKASTHYKRYAINVHTPITYDLVGQVAKSTKLTRRTVVAILKGINKAVFAQFTHNPETFIGEISRIINEEKARLIVQKISYELTAQSYNSNEIFVDNVPLPDNATPATRHIYDFVPTDSKIEQHFVKALEEAVDDVVVYAKLPKNFEIPTPFGGYNPDWAIAFNQDKAGQKIRNVYFIAETKGGMSQSDLRDSEKHKIQSAKLFFEKLGQAQSQDDTLLTQDKQAGVDSVPISYQVVDSFERLIQIVQ